MASKWGWGMAGGPGDRDKMSFFLQTPGAPSDAPGVGSFVAKGASSLLG
jgi:hypothetical protein